MCIKYLSGAICTLGESRVYYSRDLAPSKPTLLHLKQQTARYTASRRPRGGVQGPLLVVAVTWFEKLSRVLYFISYKLYSKFNRTTIYYNPLVFFFT